MSQRSTRSNDVISYLDMCQREGANLERGMNFRSWRNYSVILMSQRPGAPYPDKVLEEGKVLIYVGHNIAKTRDRAGIDPNCVDQPMKNRSGSLTQNGLFYNAAQAYKSKKSEPELVRVYEKIRPSIWTYNGMFHLVDGWMEHDGKRNAFRFKLTIVDVSQSTTRNLPLDHNRMIPSEVKREVWTRDNGRCRICGGKKNLHFDHVIPFSKGGSSLVSENVQLLCARHNLEKSNRIQ